MNTEQIHTEFNETFTQLLETLAVFGIENFNAKPAPDKWSAGQVARHLIKANSGFAKVVNGTSAAAERAPDAAVEKNQKRFSEF